MTIAAGSDILASDIVDNINRYGADSVGTDAYAITPTPAITAYAAGQHFSFKAGTANTGACTLNVSGLGAKTIKKNASEDLVTGDILVNQIVQVVYDGTNMQMISSLPIISPIVRTYEIASSARTSRGDTTTRFDITNPSGSTFRYTWDGTGTDPAINTTNFPAGHVVTLFSNLINANNCGQFLITASGTNYFEVTNSAGVAENDKVINTNGTLRVSNSTTQHTWTKPTGLKYIVVEVQGAGGAGQLVSAGNATGGGGGGGYAKKLISASSLSSTETIYSGLGGMKCDDTSQKSSGGSLSQFGSSVIGYGSATMTDSESGGIGGTATGGDINIQGGDGYSGLSGSQDRAGNGGNSVLGNGGAGAYSSTAGKDGRGYGSGGGGAYNSLNPGAGANGIVIVTEYY